MRTLKVANLCLACALLTALVGGELGDEGAGRPNRVLQNPAFMLALSACFLGAGVINVVRNREAAELSLAYARLGRRFTPGFLTPLADLLSAERLPVAFHRWVAVVAGTLAVTVGAGFLVFVVIHPL